MSKEQLINPILKKFDRQIDFEVIQQVNDELKIYELNYEESEGLNCLEDFADGSFTIGGKIKVTRKYLNSGVIASDRAKGISVNYTYYTRVESLLSDEPVAQIGLVHGFSQDSDTFLEIAYQLALNNFRVHLIDNEAFGFSSG